MVKKGTLPHAPKMLSTDLSTLISSLMESGDNIPIRSMAYESFSPRTMTGKRTVAGA